MRPLTVLLLTVWCASLAAAERTILFVDDHDVLYRPGTQRVLHQPKRDAANPLLSGLTLKNQIAYNSVYRDPSTDRWQIWYQMFGNDCVVCYAESVDGNTWTKPDLDLITLKGIGDRNVVFNSVEQNGASIVVDPVGGNSGRRYKMAYCSKPAGDVLAIRAIEILNRFAKHGNPD